MMTLIDLLLKEENINNYFKDGIRKSDLGEIDVKEKENKSKKDRINERI